jgi:hypothetical protein
MAMSDIRMVAIDSHGSEAELVCSQLAGGRWSAGNCGLGVGVSKNVVLRAGVSQDGFTDLQSRCEKQPGIGSIRKASAMLRIGRRQRLFFQGLGLALLGCTHALP